MSEKTEIYDLNVLNDTLNQQLFGKETEAKPKAKPKKKSLVLKDNEISMEKSFGFTSVFGKDKALLKHKKSDWSEAAQQHIPDKSLLEGYIFPARETEFVLAGLQGNDRILLTGDKGTGKSTIVERVCAVLNIPFYRIACNRDLTADDVFGSPTIENGTMGWSDGPCTQACIDGGVFQIDEISATPSGLTLAFQWLLEKEGKLWLAAKPGPVEDRLIIPHKSTRFVATDNTVLQGDPSAKFAGTEPQNSALLDRFSMTVTMDFLPKEHERKILRAALPEVSTGEIENALELAHMLRHTDLQFGMSIRSLLEFLSKALLFGNVEGLKLSFYNKLLDEDKKIVAEIFYKIYGVEL